MSISLPDRVLREVEPRREETQETRSDFFRRAAECLLRQDRRRAAIGRYVEGYLQDPESGVDKAWADLGAARLQGAEW